MSDLTQAAQSPETLEIAAARIAALEAELATATAAVTVCNANAEAYREALERAEEALSAIWISGALKPGAMVALGNAIARARETLTTAPPPSSELASLRAQVATKDDALRLALKWLDPVLAGSVVTRDIRAALTPPAAPKPDAEAKCCRCGHRAGIHLPHGCDVDDCSCREFADDFDIQAASPTPVEKPAPDATVRCPRSELGLYAERCSKCGGVHATTSEAKDLHAEVERLTQASQYHLQGWHNVRDANERLRAELDKAKAVIERNEVSMRAQWNQIQTVKDHWHRTERERDAAQAELDKAKAEIATLKAQVAHE